MKWVVAFKGSRDAYQVPLALAEAGKLEALVTDWYSPFDREWFSRSINLLPALLGAALKRRYQQGLASTMVRSRPLELVRTKLDARRASDAGDNRIGALAGQLAGGQRSGLLSYSYYGHAAFTSPAASRLPKIIFQVHPHPASIRALLSEEMERVPEARASLSGEVELNMPPRRYAQLCEEPLLADMCLAASQYTKNTLVENGIRKDRVRVIPYGVDLEKFYPAPILTSTAAPFRVLFAGQMVQRKGLSYLLEAWRRLALPKAELTLVGRGQMDERLLAKYEGSYRLKVGVSASELKVLFQSSDVCCVPSLVEGFGLVYLESLACGTPVIATPNTGAADLIHDGDGGFIVPIRDVEALMERLEWCYEHRIDLAEMREACRRLAERHTWDAFRHNLVAAVREVEQQLCS